MMLRHGSVSGERKCRLGCREGGLASTRMRRGRRRKGIVCRDPGLIRERTWLSVAGRTCSLVVSFVGYEELAVDAIVRMSGRRWC